ncbi:dihydroorotate dehydrogenase electron transfer subunit [Vagococcus carniphilus]|uniref:Dihydroorotate dehydrogenase B (NAD(+)), electron transfer subunit n=1 Tax=Vagococcus carniphilus TaxID=218144 RepID=A0A430AUG8_9ENTE|nr:dihydroorotate dehydrogenase electron transfer subunit [Vagococcus carniphilus]QNN71944.1 dihydroorotate dehydrogenase electron transfer subunit [Vagococcus carniphilus]RSU11700.1 dihydroorotate dehydrogenase electron transfer subunit [Vagococcus carniphilus]
MKQEMMVMTKQVEIAENIFELTLQGKLVQEMNQPGQFIHIRVPRSDLLLRRPISLANISKENETCQIIYRAEGEGTKVLSQLEEGTKIDCLGPLGNGFNIEEVVENDVVFLVGGGIGVPPLYELGKKLAEKKAKIIFMHGFANKNAIFYEKEFSDLGVLMLATDDGSYGYKGHTGDLMNKALKVHPNPKAIYACGPSGLLKSVEMTFPNHPHVYLSMEERMACGIGACYACVCPSKKDPTVNKKVCDEGPVFKSGEVII